MPTPRAITGRVATFTPMPSAAISALPSTEVRISGRTMQRVAAKERKVIMHMAATNEVIKQSELIILVLVYICVAAFLRAKKTAAGAAVLARLGATQ